MDKGAAPERPTVSLADLVAVAVGGALGTLLRVAGLAAGPGVGRGVAVAGEDVGVVSAILSPTGVTLLENLVGAGLLGLFLGLLMTSRRLNSAIPRRLRLLLTTGLLGSFTTFSALALDGALLLGVDATGMEPGGWPSGARGAAVLILLSLTGGLALAFAGLLVGRRLGGGGTTPQVAGGTLQREEGEHPAGGGSTRRKGGALG